MAPISLETLAFWPSLTQQQRETLTRAARPAVWRPGEIIRGVDRDCLGVLLVREGMLRVYLLSRDGREATIFRIPAGEVCVLAAACSLSAITFQVQIQAEGETRALVIPVQVISALMKENLYVENFVYKSAAQRFSDTIRAVEQMLFRTLEQRVAAYLTGEARRLGTDTLRVTQEQLAQAIGSAREAVTRTLKKLSQAGLVELFRGGVRLLDREGLERLAS